MSKKTFLLIISSIVLYVGLTSCNKNEKKPRGDDFTTVPKQSADDDGTVTKELESIGVFYFDNYQDYSSKTLVEACEERQINVLKSSEAKITETLKSMSVAADQYHDSALEFYRKLKLKKESLSKITALLVPYCEQDHKISKACVSESNPVMLYLNAKNSSSLIVHPVIIPNPDKKSGLYLPLRSNQDEVETIRAIDLASEKETQSSSGALPEISTVAHLENIFNCLAGADLKSEVAQKIKATARVSFQLGRRDCMLNKVRIDEAKRKSVEENQDFSYQVSAKNAKYCGSYLK